MMSDENSNMAEALSLPRVAQLKTMVTSFTMEHMPVTMKELRGTGGASIADCLGEACKFLQDASSTQTGGTSLGEKAEAVRNECWQKLSVGGGWPSVGWREAYVCSLYMISLDILDKRCKSNVSSDTQDLRDAMQHLDMALVMGGPAACDVVHQIVDVIEPTIMAETRAAGQQEPSSQETDYIVSDHLPACAPVVEEARSIRKAGSIPFQEFKKDFFKTDTPVVLSGVIKDWPGMTRWKDLRYFKREFGHSVTDAGILVCVLRFAQCRTVPVEVGRLAGGRKKEGWREESLLFKDLVDQYLMPSNVRCRAGEDNRGDEVAYLAQHALFDQLPRLQNDLIVPDYCECGGLEGVNAWLGTAGTVTPLHCDSYDNFLTQVVGFKYVRLYDRKQTPFLYVSKSKGAALDDVTAQGNLSPVECEAPDFEKFPLLRNASYTEAILSPGDMLYIPSKHWHYVRSLSPSFSVNFWF